MENEASVEQVQGAEEAQSVKEEQTGTWVNDGEGLEYPQGTDNYHSGEEKLTGEDRLDALCDFLERHGIFVPWAISSKE